MTLPLEISLKDRFFNKYKCQLEPGMLIIAKSTTALKLIRPFIVTEINHEEPFIKLFWLGDYEQYGEIGLNINKDYEQILKWMINAYHR